MARQRPARKPKPTRAFPLSDYTNLESLFAGKPELVLSYFEAAQIVCLRELDLFVRMQTEQPTTAARIVFIAATMGIPECC